MPDIKKQNIAFWTENVPGIDNQVNRDMAGSLDFYKKVDEVRYWQEPYLNDLFPKILKSGLVSLEVGCGLGTDLRTFSRAGLEVTGLDYSPENAYLSKLGLQVCNLKGNVVSGDAECLPFPDESFDLVYSWGCLHHTPNTQKSINEISRVLRPGGKTVIMLYHKGYQFWCILGCYIFGLKWLKYTLQDYISLKYDQTPLSQMFSRNQLYNMFKDYQDVTVQVITYGGIQAHPTLKYIWKLFQSSPWLMGKFGSFGIITARKPGNFTPAGVSPKPCCPICYSMPEYQTDGIKCTNTSCETIYPIHKNIVPIFHTNTARVYQYSLKGTKK